MIKYASKGEARSMEAQPLVSSFGACATTSSTSGRPRKTLPWRCSSMGPPGGGLTSVRDILEGRLLAPRGETGACAEVAGRLGGRGERLPCCERLARGRPGDRPSRVRPAYYPPAILDGDWEHRKDHNYQRDGEGVGTAAVQTPCAVGERRARHRLGRGAKHWDVSCGRRQRHRYVLRSFFSLPLQSGNI